MKINRNSWHYKSAAYFAKHAPYKLWKSGRPSEYLCGYFWQAILLGPLCFTVRGIFWVLEWTFYIAIAIAMVTLATILTTGFLWLYLPIYDSDPEFTTAMAIISTIAYHVAAGVFITHLRNTRCDPSPVLFRIGNLRRPAPREPGLLTLRYRAYKERVCPRLTFVYPSEMDSHDTSKS